MSRHSHRRPVHRRRAYARSSHRPALIRAAGLPVAAPSANRFTELSPTTADHVRRSLGSDVDLILNGGPCQNRHRIHRPLARRSSAHPSSPRHHSTHGAGINHRFGRPRPRPSNRSPSRPRNARAPLQPTHSPVLGHKRKHSRHGQGIYLQHEHAPSRTGGNVAIPPDAPIGTRLRRRALRSSPPGRCRKLRLDCRRRSSQLTRLGRHPGPTETSRLEFLIPNSYATVLQPLLPSLGLFRITRCNS